MDPKSAYCAKSNVYYSKLAPAEVPSHPTDLVTYLFAPKRVDRGVGDTVAVVDGVTGKKLTYSQLDDTVRVVAAGLWQQLGIRKSDVVAILSPNSVEFEVLFLAVASLGAITTSLNPLNTNTDIKKLIRGAGGKLGIHPSFESLSIHAQFPFSFSFWFVFVKDSIRPTQAAAKDRA